MIINDKYSVKTDAYNFILVEKCVTQQGKKAGETYEVNVGYYSTLKALLHGLVKREVLLTDMQDIQTVNDKLKELEKLIHELELK